MPWNRLRSAVAWACLALALAFLGVAVPAAAHEVHHEVIHEVHRGRAVAVHAWFPDGENLAHVQAEVFSPADPKIPYWNGRTDRNGWLAFVPDVSGRWRVRIVDATGHGLDTTVEVASPIAAGEASGSGPSGVASLAFVLRPAVGVVLIAAIFGFLYLRGRRRPS